MARLLQEDEKRREKQKADPYPSWYYAPIFDSPFEKRRVRFMRRAIARLHSYGFWTLRSTAPRWYRRIFDHRLRTKQVRELRRWLDDQEYDLAFRVRQRHGANWS